jgi:hypothetical protein
MRGAFDTKGSKSKTHAIASKAGPMANLVGTDRLHSFRQGIVPIFSAAVHDSQNPRP